MRSSSDRPQPGTTFPCGGRRSTRCRRWQLAALPMGIALAALIGLACALPDDRHRLLSIFFDGVPDSASATDAPAEKVDQVVGAQVPAEPLLPEIRKHGPYSPGECDLCHVSQYSNRLALPVPELCASCHEPDAPRDPFVHGPVAAGDCLACHDPHRSRYPPLLVLASNALCESCHDRSTFTGHADDDSADREAVCAECHDPHGSPVPSLIRPTSAHDDR